MRALRLKFAAATAAIAVVGALIPGISAAAPSPGNDVLFEADGGLIRGFGPTGLSITDLNFAFTCVSPPPSQGVDGHVFDLGLDTPLGADAVATGETSSPLGYDLDLVFYNSACDFLGSSFASGSWEVALDIPEGTHYVVVTAFTGVDTLPHLRVTGPAPTSDETSPPTPEEYLRGDYSDVPNDPLYADQWNMDIINAPEAWQEEQATGYGITISVVDSGVDTTHPDLTCPFKMVVREGSDVGSDDDNPLDEDGHGTHVNGIAGACSDNNRGVVGVAPDSILMPVKVFGYPAGAAFGLAPDTFDQAMADGIRFATENGAHVINLSIGDKPPFSHFGAEGYPETEEALAEARTAGVVVAAAAGNFTQPTCEFPSRSRNVICVVATGPEDTWASYSDLAVNVDPRAGEPGLEPVVAAPGGDGGCEGMVVSTYWRDAEHGGCAIEGSGYDWLSGTSMASPHVAGLAALLYDRLGGVRSKATADQIVQIIMDTADDLGAPGYDPQFGYGRINAQEAILSVEAVPHVTYPLPPPF